mmetsp:Transcript_9974/g.27596  ORF Transcript_9974/g.27596 Transcript_9974/m.27596 type:complete len:435 (-) Transcript_9974:149-1453(-)
MSSPPEGRPNGGGMGADALMQAFNMGPEPHRAPVAQETPTMRSLAIGSSGPPLLQRPATFGKPPPLGIQRPRSISRRSSGSIGLKQEWDNPCTTWKVSKNDLEPVPEDFPLERTHRYLHDVDAPEVAKRISDVLRCHSIQSEFKAKPPKAKCKTLDFVSFRIRLFAGDESGSPVVVEVQKRSGPTSCFMHACRAILNAAEGKKAEEQSAHKMPPFMTKPIGQMKCLKDVTIVSDDESDPALTALKDCVSMIRSKKRDSNVLGLENLCALTDPIKTKPTSSVRVAKLVTFAQEDIDIREDLFAMIERDVYTAEDEDVALSNHADLLRQLALTVFANALSLCAKDKSLSGKDGEQSWFADNLLPTLVTEIKRAPADACSATQAAMCVNSIASCSGSGKEFLADQGVVAALRKANVYGCECNNLLADETKDCLQLFN